MLSYLETPIQRIQSHWLEKAGIQLFVKREDLNHFSVSGNKWWKLKYNLEEARRLGFGKLLTFGGAYSNHLFAVAAAAREIGFESIGIIRGEETLPLNSTLHFAKSQGMQLHYFSRETYRKKSEPAILENLKQKFGNFYLIPEGGTNSLAIKGCAELASRLLEFEFDHLCLPVGTGGTLAGMVVGLEGKKKLTGFSVLKGGGFLKEEVEKLCADYSGTTFSNWQIALDYHFGGYAKSKTELIDFAKSFQQEHAIPLELIYTAKMMLGIVDLVGKGHFARESTILALHTGGLQNCKNDAILVADHPAQPGE